MLLEKIPSRLDQSPLTGSIETFPSVHVEVVSDTKWEMVWDELVSTHHYLGYVKLLGNRLKYLVFLEERVVATLSLQQR